MNTQIVPRTNTMSSLEIAELTGKQHAHVMRDIRRMVEQFEAAKQANPNLDWHCESGSYLDAQGKARELYRLDKNTTTTLLSGYDVVARHKIVVRWQELEGNQTQVPALPLTPMEMLVQQMQGLLVVGQQMVETQRDLAEVKSDVSEMKLIQAEAKAGLLSLPAPTEAMPELAIEDKVRLLVNTYAAATVTPIVEVWRTLYSKMYYHYRVNVTAHKLNPGESKLQMLKRIGQIDNLYIVASNTLRVD